MTFQTPILLITFNRPDHTAKVLSSIEEQQPERMFVFRDGPRPNVLEDIQKCQRVEDMIRQEINWGCELKTCIETKNLGCGCGPAKAITWFFEHVEEGIILEDDCLPSHSFFTYCQKLLEFFRHDEGVFMISGFNHLERWKPGKIQFFLSYMSATYGWASWKRAWRYFDFQISNWEKSEVKERIRDNFSRDSYYHTFKNDFDFVITNRPKDIWDYQWFFARISNNGSTIIPSKNLIRNIGFGKDSTHTFNENDLGAKIKNLEIDMPANLPMPSNEPLYDWIVYERFFNRKKRPFYKKVVLKLLKLIYEYK